MSEQTKQEPEVKQEVPQEEVTGFTINEQYYFDVLSGIHTTEGAIKLDFVSLIPNARGPSTVKAIQIVLPITDLPNIKMAIDQTVALRLKGKTANQQ